MLFKVHDIEWECDGENPQDLNLPVTLVQIESDGIEEVIDDLSNQYGFLIESVGEIERFDPVTLNWVDASNE
jgi:hypothetical protein